MPRKKCGKFFGGIVKIFWGGELVFVNFYFQQVEIHQSGIEREMSYTDTHIFCLKAFVVD